MATLAEDILQQHLITDEIDPLTITCKVIKLIESDITSNQNIIPIYVEFPINSHIRDWSTGKRILHPINKLMNDVDGVILRIDCLNSNIGLRYGIDQYDVIVSPDFDKLSKCFEELSQGTWDTRQPTSLSNETIIRHFDVKNKIFSIYIDNIPSLISLNNFLP